MIETERLCLRSWRSDDLAIVSRINADPDVAYWLGGPFGVDQTQAWLDLLIAHEAEHGFTFWAVERKDQPGLIGAVGLARIGPQLPVRSGVEIGWRLARDSWGYGYASEAALAVIDHAWSLGLAEVIAFTAGENVRSRQVMERLGMSYEPESGFLHPRLADNHSLRAHVLYAIGNPHG